MPNTYKKSDKAQAFFALDPSQERRETSKTEQADDL